MKNKLVQNQKGDKNSLKEKDIENMINAQVGSKTPMLICNFITEVYETDKLTELIERLSQAFKREKYLQHYFGNHQDRINAVQKSPALELGNEDDIRLTIEERKYLNGSSSYINPYDTFMHIQKDNDLLTTMNHYSWEDDSIPYVKTFENIVQKSSSSVSQASQNMKKVGNSQATSRFLKETNNFKMRYKKLIKKLSKKLVLSDWHKYFMVGRFDILARCINPIVKNNEPNKEMILRRNVFKTLYKYCSMAINRSLLVKEIVTEDEDASKLVFVYISWITPNF